MATPYSNHGHRCQTHLQVYGWYRSPVASDPELLAAWREGDARAGQELFARYFEPVSLGSSPTSSKTIGTT